jgi:hypothetical protein
MVSRTLALRNIEDAQDGKLALSFHDDEFDYDVRLVLKSDDLSQLGVYPGSKVKLSLEKG